MALFPEAFGFMMQLVFTLIASFFSGILLWITTKLFKIPKSGFGTALMITFIVGIVNLLIGAIIGRIPFIGLFAGVFGLLVSIVLGILLIKHKYQLETGRAFLVWFVWLILSFIIVGLLFVVFAVLFVGGALIASAGGIPP